VDAATHDSSALAWSCLADGCCQRDDMLQDADLSTARESLTECQPQVKPRPVRWRRSLAELRRHLSWRKGWLIAQGREIQKPLHQ